MANLIGEPYDPYVSSQINARQKIYGKKVNRTSEEISYLNSSNAWIKLASAVEIDQDRLNILKKNNNYMAIMSQPGKNLAMQNVLFNGLTSYGEYMDKALMNKILKESGGKYNKSDFQVGGKLENRRGEVQKYIQQRARAGIGGVGGAYGIDGADFGYSPMPGITDLNVKDLNRGSIKKATLNIKAFNRNQLEIIDCLYMRLGYTVLLEWGHSKYWDDTQNKLANQPASLIDTEFFKDNQSKSDYRKFLPKIQAHRELTRGNYDAMFGTVSNFSWTFENDGSYNCKIEIISLGDIVESLGINITSEESSSEQNRKISQTQFQSSPARSQNQFYAELYPNLKEDLKKYFNENQQKLEAGNVAGIVDFDKKPENFIFGEETTVSEGGSKIAGTEVPTCFLNLVNIGGFIDSSVRTPDEYQAFITASQDPNTPPLSESEKEIQRDKSLMIKNISVVMGQSGYREYDKYIGGGETERIASTYSSGREVLLEYYCKVLTDAFKGDKQLEIKLRSEISGSEKILKLEKITKRGEGTSLAEITKTSKPTFDKIGDGPTEDNEYTGYNANSLKGTVLLNYSTCVAKPYYQLEQGEPIGFLQISKRTPSGPYEAVVSVPDSDVWLYSFGKGGRDTVLNRVQKQIIARLANEEDFYTFVYNKFVNFGRAGGAQDPRFKTEEPTIEAGQDEKKDEGLRQIEEFKKIQAEKSVRGNIFKYFYSIRNLYAPSPAASIVSVNEAEKESSFWSKKVPLNDIVEFKGLDQASNHIQCFGLTVGYSLNPGKTIDVDLAKIWNKNVSYPIYRDPESTPPTPLMSQNPQTVTPQPITNPTTNVLEELDNLFSNKKINYIPFNRKGEQIAENAGVDFFKLNISEIDQSYYIRFGTFLAYIRDQNIPGIDSDGNPPMISIDTEEKNNVCYVIDNVVSTDPRKIIINNHRFYEGYDSNSEIYSGINRFIEGDEQMGFYGNLMNVYINFSRIEEILDKNQKDGKIILFDLISLICKDINECLGHVNNLEPVVDKIKNQIKIIDQTVIPNAKDLFPSLQDKQQAVLEVFGYNGDKSNFVHNIGITTQISKDYATQISIGATSKGAIPGTEATAFSKWNIGIRDRFKNNLTSPDTATSSEDNALAQLEKDNKAVLQNYNSNIIRRFAMLGFTESTKGDDEVVLTFNTEFIKNTAKVCKDYYTYAQARSSLDEEDSIIESSIGFIPFNLKVDMEGMSGFKIYNRLKVNTNFLPSNYDETLDFIITGVNHTISGNQWKTNLESLATSKSVLAK